MIVTQTQLGELVRDLEQAPWLALDTEADSLHCYPEKLCLIQISLPGRDVLVDPLVKLDLDPLKAVLGGRELILHGADYDLRLLHRTLGFVPQIVFDTMIAARLLGIAEFGLNNLIQRFLGLHLEKGSQKANWSIRPLTEKMVTYARNDTHFLRPLSDLLRAELVQKGRLAWLEQTCLQLIQDCSRVEPEDPDGVWRVKGTDRLDRRSMGIVRELWHWREREARAANKPPFYVLAHETLVAIANAAAHDHPLDTLVPNRFSPHRRSGLLHAVQIGLALPEAKLPLPRRSRGRRMTMSASERLEALRTVRDRRAGDLGIDPTLIASRATLTALAVDWEAHQSELLPWQRDLLMSR